MCAAAAGANGATPQAETLATPQQQQPYNPPASTAIPPGERRHVLSVFVSDEAGLINQVSRVFTEAGRNIESLAVGLNVDTALFTITVVGTPQHAADLLERLQSLPKVLYVEDLTSVRTEVTQLARIFRARILDASEDFITLSVTGDAGKTLVLQSNLMRFGIVQLARTGTVALKRGNLLLEVTATMATVDDGDSPGAQLAPADAAASGELQSLSTELWAAKQAVSEEGVALGVLDESHTLSIEVADEPGALSHVTAGLARISVNVQSLAVGSSESPGRSRITVVVPRDDAGLPSIIEQMESLPIVGFVRDLTELPFVSQELMMVKVRCQPRQRGDVREVAGIFHGRVVDVSKETMTLELQGKEVKMIAAQTVLEEFGILEVARTGRVAMPRDSGVNTKMLNTMRMGQVML